MAKKQKNSEETVSSLDFLNNYLTDNKEHHYNFEDEVNYKVSTGSLKVDIETGGGLGPGIHRFCGPKECGKTSEALTILNNFLIEIPNSKGVLIKAEGRLTPEMKERSGIKFVYDPKEWKVGTCFVFDSNVYETAFELVNGLLRNNPEKFLYCFVVDSVDALVPKEALEKDLSQAEKVSGGAVIASHFLRKVNLSLQKRGHMGIFISQQRASINLTGYGASGPNYSGGFALEHYPNWILEFKKKSYSSCFDSDGKTMEKYIPSKIAGHYVKIGVEKSVNEKTLQTFTYPVKYGRKGGNSIWMELEIVEILIMFEIIQKSGSWLNFSDNFIQDLKDNNITLDGLGEKFQGKDKLLKFIEENKPFKEFAIKRIKESLTV